jgi:hypothetical protein
MGDGLSSGGAMNEAVKSRRNVWSDLSQGRPDPNSRVPRGRDQSGDHRYVVAPMSHL